MFSFDFLVTGQGWSRHSELLPLWWAWYCRRWLVMRLQVEKLVWPVAYYDVYVKPKLVWPVAHYGVYVQWKQFWPVAYDNASGSRKTGLETDLTSCSLWCVVWVKIGFTSCLLWCVYKAKTGLGTGLTSCSLWCVCWLKAGLANCLLWCVLKAKTGLGTGLISCLLRCKVKTCLELRRTSWFFLKVGHSRPLFFIFVFSIQLTVNVQCKCLLMTGFELRTFGIGSNRSTNWATTTVPTSWFLKC